MAANQDDPVSAECESFAQQLEQFNDEYRSAKCWKEEAYNSAPCQEIVTKKRAVGDSAPAACDMKGGN